MLYLPLLVLCCIVSVTWASESSDVVVPSPSPEPKTITRRKFKPVGEMWKNVKSSTKSVVTEKIPHFVTKSIPHFVTKSIPHFVTKSIPHFVTKTIPEAGKAIWKGLGEVNWGQFLAEFCLQLALHDIESRPRAVYHNGDWYLYHPMPRYYPYGHRYHLRRGHPYHRYYY